MKVVGVIERQDPLNQIFVGAGSGQKGKEHVGYCVVSVPSSAIRTTFFFDLTSSSFFSTTTRQWLQQMNHRSVMAYPSKGPT